MKQGRGARIFAAVCIGFLCALTFSAFTDFDRTCREVRQDVIRLHVLANSDGAEDQALKLKVRDRVLEQVDALYKEGQSRDQMEQALAQNRALLQRTAEETVREAGYAYPVSVELADCYFSTRDYESFTLPAGTYRALRVVIGAGKGKNWWCVAFPPLCLPAGQEEALSAFSPEETEIITHPEKYQVKFAAVEFLENVKARLGL